MLFLMVQRMQHQEVEVNGLNPSGHRTSMDVHRTYRLGLFVQVQNGTSWDVQNSPSNNKSKIVRPGTSIGRPHLKEVYSL